jgi:hypothetical protein
MATGVPGTEATPAVTLGAELAVKPSGSSPLTPPKAPPAKGAQRRVYTWVAAGSAVAAAAAGAYFGASANTENDKIDDGTIRTAAEIKALQDRADRKAKTANVLYGAAGAAAAAGVTLFFIEGSF